MYTYYPTGVCSSKYTFEIADGVISAIEIDGGCSGNLMGLTRLLTGMKVDDVIAQLSGVTCKGSESCPNQIAEALKAYKKEQEARK